MTDCIQKVPERSGLYTSIFFSMAGGCQIFSYIFNSFILGNFSASTLFLLDTLISLIPVIVFQMLPDPILPENYVEKKQNFKESFHGLLHMMKDARIHKMIGIFFNTAVASSVSQGLLITFYCLILKGETLQD